MAGGSAKRLRKPALRAGRGGYNQAVMKRKSANLRARVRRYRTGCIVGSCALVVHLLGTSALAQSPAKLPNEDGGYLQWGIALGIVVVVAFTAFLNPKRSHLA